MLLYAYSLKKTKNKQEKAIRMQNDKAIVELLEKIIGQKLEIKYNEQGQVIELKIRGTNITQIPPEIWSAL